MKGAALGPIISAAGYLLAIYGGWVLYRNAAPDNPYGTVPRGTREEVMEFQRQQEKDIEDRAKANPRGFLCLTVGAILQLAGTLVAGFVS